MSVKVILTAVVVVVVVGVLVAGGCAMFLTDLLGLKGGHDVANDGTVIPSVAVVPGSDQDEASFSSESAMLPTDEEGMVDGMFPDHTTDDLKLKLILKALDILKTLDAERPDYVGNPLPGNDDMKNELKLRLILKAVSLLGDKPLDSMFEGRVVAELKLTLLLKAILILKDAKLDWKEFTDGLDSLKVNLVRKALYILEKYPGNFEDTVFGTDSKVQLQLKLTLIVLSLPPSGRHRHRHGHHHGHRHARHVSGGQPIIGGRSGTADLHHQRWPTIDNGGLVPRVTRAPPSARPTPFGEREKPARGGEKRPHLFQWLSRVHRGRKD